MTEDSKKNPENVTEASAVELEESSLDDVQGGVFTGYLKIPDIDGESSDKVDSFPKVEVKGISPGGTYKFSGKGFKS